MRDSIKGKKRKRNMAQQSGGLKKRKRNMAQRSGGLKKRKRNSPAERWAEEEEEEQPSRAVG